MRISASENNYVKPKVTTQDIISNDMNMFKEKLEGCVQIHKDNYEDIDTGIWLKYITSDNKYRSGGILINNKFPQYFVLKNPYLIYNYNTNYILIQLQQLLRTETKWVCEICGGKPNGYTI